MKLIQLSAFVILSSILTSAYGQQPVPFTDKRWVIQAQGQLLEGYKGQNSLYLQGGTACLKDANFLNGSIEFDVYLAYQVSFSGLFFRMTDQGNYEELYLRAQQSGYPDAYQYTPVFNNDPAWQLYHDQYDGVNDGFISWKPRGKTMGYNGALSFPFDRWLHVRLLVKGSQAELYLDNNPEPVAFIRELLMGNHAGGIGVKSGIGAAHFANFTYTVSNEVLLKTKDDGYVVNTPPGTISSWQVSNPFKENSSKNMNELDTKWLGQLKWKSAPVEPTGLVNLSRFSTVSDSVNTVLAKFTVVSDKDQVKKLDIGYSDRVKVYCNGTALYSGNASFRTRDFRYLGTIGYFDAVYLPLKKGENTIVFAIAETFGGWGIMAKW
ncbi:MAG: hypothetical protein ABI688_09530 [Bacteroidota bacterium]